MCISCFAAYLNPFHPVGKIRFFHHQALVYRLGETRPSATRIKLIGRDEQRFPGRDIYVDAFTLFIPIFILESSFRSVLLCYRILFGGEFCDTGLFEAFPLLAFRAKSNRSGLMWQ